MTLIKAIVAINGIYDIICACCILLLGLEWGRKNLSVFSFFSTLHADMFEKEEHKSHPVILRFLAYWLLTYGIIRLTAGGCERNNNNACLPFAALTYFIEAFCFIYEYIIGQTMIKSKVGFVSVASTSLGITILTISCYYFEL